MVHTLGKLAMGGYLEYVLKRTTFLPQHISRVKGRVFKMYILGVPQKYACNIL
jgi:hypothetical protein